jgi:hypothetical protein
MAKRGKKRRFLTRITPAGYVVSEHKETAREFIYRRIDYEPYAMVK